MGTRGYVVWRFRDRYYCLYQGCDAYPDVLGVELWHQIPKTEADAERWIQRKRRWIEETLERGDEEQDSDELDGELMRGPRPKNDVMIEWVYEIDLDNSIFHVQNIPLCALRRMPPRQVILDLEEHKSNIIRSYPDIAPKNRWDSVLEEEFFRVANDILDEYAALSISIVDHIVPPPPDNETTKVRRRFAEQLISDVYRTRPFVSAVLQAHETYDTRPMAKNLCGILDFMNKVTLQPPTIVTGMHMYILHSGRTPNKPLAELRERLNMYDYEQDDQPSRTTWARANVCAYFHPHLTHADNLRAGVVKTVRAIVASSQKGVVYGVVNSVTHCVLLSYDSDTDIVKHTPALPLLPPWSSTDTCASTSGIVALTDLCQHLDRLDGGHPNFLLLKTTGSCQLPFDVLAHIATSIQDSDTLLSFAAASSVCKQAAEPRLMLPKWDEHIIESVHEEPSMVRCADGELRDLRSIWKSDSDIFDLSEILGLFTEFLDENELEYHDFERSGLRKLSP